MTATLASATEHMKTDGAGHMDQESDYQHTSPLMFLSFVCSLFFSFRRRASSKGSAAIALGKNLCGGFMYSIRSNLTNAINDSLSGSQKNLQFHVLQNTHERKRGLVYLCENQGFDSSICTRQFTATWDSACKNDILYLVLTRYVFVYDSNPLTFIIGPSNVNNL